MSTSFGLFDSDDESKNNIKNKQQQIPQEPKQFSQKEKIQKQLDKVGKEKVPRHIRKVAKQNNVSIKSYLEKELKKLEDTSKMTDHSELNIKTLNKDIVEFTIDLKSFLYSVYENNIEINQIQQEEAQALSQEDDDGPVEYKLKLVNPPEERIQKLTSQMKFRLAEGKGEAIYEIGVEDNGNPLGLNLFNMWHSLKTLLSMASALNSDLIILKMKQGIQGKIAEIMVRQNQKEGIKLDIRILVLGDVGAGKSTLVGVLISGQNDNGKGMARMKVFHHKHEVLSGRTSSVSHHILGFDSQGNITNHCQFGNLSWEQIIDSSTKLLTFIDIGGHEKTILSGLCSHYPDYAIIVISAEQGITKVCENHLKLALAFQVPLIFVITHIDNVNSEQINTVITSISELLQHQESNKTLLVMNNDKDVVQISGTLKDNITPVFLISSVTGYQLDLFKTFLNLLPVSEEWTAANNVDMHTEFYIHERFDVQGEIVLGGTVIKGQIKVHQNLHLGPDEKGNFRSVEVTGLQCKRVPVTSATCGQACTVAIKLGKFATEWLAKNNQAIRKGMVLIDSNITPRAFYEFQAEIRLFDTQNSEIVLNKSYEPVINSQTTRQTCVLIDEEEFKNDIESPLTLTRTKSKSIDLKAQNKQINKNKIINYVINNTKKRRKSQYILEAESKNNLEINSIKKEFKNLYLSKSQNNLVSEAKNNSQMYKYSRFAEQNQDQQINVNLVNNVPLTLWPNKINSLRFRFKYYPEYIVTGQKIIINDPNLKAIGTIKHIYY